MKDEIAPPNPSLWRISLLNKLLLCAVCCVWAASLLPEQWLVPSWRFLPSWFGRPMKWLEAHGMPTQKAAKPVNRTVGQQYFLNAYRKALEKYAGDHAGRFPAQFSDLMPAYLPSRRSYPDLYNEDGTLRSWIYFPGYTTSSAGNPILLAAPTPIGKGRLLYVSMGQSCGPNRTTSNFCFSSRHASGEAK
jgi:hypothetical protein